jgi:hypothetical protein
MHHRKKHFLQILEIEFEDLQEDIDLLIEQCQKQQQEGRMTEHVFFENIAIFRNEERGLEQFKRIVHELNSDDYADLDALIAECKTRFLRRIKECGMAPFIDILVDRKINKVVRYVNQ